MIALFVSLCGVSTAQLGGKVKISSRDVVNNSLTSADIKKETLKSSDIRNQTLKSSDYGAGSVGTTAVQPSAITNEKIATAAITAPKLAGEAVTEPKLAEEAVTRGKVAPGGITSSKLAVETFPSVSLTTTADVPIHNADSAGLVPVAWNSEVSDTANAHSNTTNPSRIVAPFSGLYQITASVSWKGQPEGLMWRSISVQKNGVGWLQAPLAYTETPFAAHQFGPTPAEEMNVSAVVQLVAGDYIELLAYSECDCGGDFDYTIDQAPAAPPSGGNPAVLATPRLTMTYQLPG